MENAQQKLLNFTGEVYQEHRENSNKYGEEFNVFSVLNITRKEVGTHSAFIYKLLNKQEKHDQKEQFLRLFMTHVLNIETKHTEKYQVKREGLTSEQRRINFTIETPSELIGIEMKIDAGDQKNQLYDYHQELKNRARHSKKHVKVYYLTLYGSEPDECSLDRLNVDEVSLISFSVHILKWLEACKTLPSLKPIVLSSIIQYEAAVKSLFGYQRSLTMTVSNEIIAKPENITAALAIERSMKQAKEKLQTKLWESLLKQLKEKGKEVETYNASKKALSASNLAHQYYFQSQNNRHLGLRYPINEQLWCYINLYIWLHYGVRKLDDKKHPVTLTAEEKYLLSDGLPNGNAVANDHSDWVICYYNDEESRPLSFSGALDEESKTLRTLADDKKMREAVEKIVLHLEAIESHVLIKIEQS
ncbi:TPA: PD-(D/E)XK nuclease family protein [Vibrio parahaemolyticus]|nr:PD-(D/E)XK nuclease family protein [Vibrio parahaemolyticus]